MGRTGSGKTYAVRELVRPVDRLLVLDLNAEWHTSCHQVHDPHAARRHLVERGAGHVDAPYRLAVVPLSEDAILDTLRLAWTLPDSWVVCEEIADYSNPGYCPPPLARLIRAGRHRRISVVTLTQRPADTPALVRSQADVLAAAQLTEPLDVDAMRKQHDAFEGALSTLCTGEWIYLDRRRETLFPWVDDWLDSGQPIG